MANIRISELSEATSSSGTDLFVIVTDVGGGNLVTKKLKFDSFLGAGDISTAQLANNAVTTIKISNLNVTEAKIAAGAVTTAKIGNAQVTTAKIGDSQVTPVKTSFFSDSGIYAGRVASGGGATKLPSGWSSTKITTGTYRVTHNLGTVNYTVTLSGTYFMLIKSAAANYFEVYSAQENGVLIDGMFHFILIKD